MKKIGLMALAVLIISAGVFTGQERAHAATPIETHPLNRVDDRGIVTAFGDEESNKLAKQVFDNNIDTNWLVFSDKPWIQYQFADNQAYAITTYSITAPINSDWAPSNWTMQGSNDGTNWTLLDTQQNIHFDQSNQKLSFPIANTTTYSYYKFDLESNNGSPIVELAEIELFDGTTYTTYLPTITASGENAPTGSKENAIDGSSRTKWQTNENRGWLEIDYGNPILIDGYAISAANDLKEADPKQWILKGSTNGSNWTEIDTKDNEVFYKRHQKNHYYLNNSTAYQYYRLDLQNNSGDTLQVGEVTLSNTKDIWHSINPIVDLRNLDTVGNGYLFEQALPNYQQEITAIIRDIVSTLYDNPKKISNNPKKIIIEILDEPGIAWADSANAKLGVSSRYLKDYYESSKNPNSTPFREELIGMLYHELTHVYQFNGNGSFPGYMSEGLADGVRLEYGYHDRYSAGPGGNWDGSYSTTGNFLLWIIEHKQKPRFLRDITASQVNWTPEAFKSITGEDVNSLWDQYQQSFAPPKPTLPTFPKITVSGENAPSGIKENAIDGNIETKWQTTENRGWLELNYGTPTYINSYAITSANDLKEADPKNWTLRGSNDGINWTWLDMKENETFFDRKQKNTYHLNSYIVDRAFQYYRLELQNNSGDQLQIGEVTLNQK
ncbi:hypothetical protein PMSD_03995 [Paenibacillus macquariensis subsp. defensor]|nr:hypothetical protein PMSD_03995 [Paenibacillus macquariensis subsp. defensor]